MIVFHAKSWIYAIVFKIESHNQNDTIFCRFPTDSTI